MLNTTLLLLLLFQVPSSGPGGLEELLSSVQASRTPDAVVQLAESVPFERAEKLVPQAKARLDGAQGVEALFLGRLLAHGDSPSGAAALAGLLAGPDRNLSLAAAFSLALPAFIRDKGAQKGLGDWLAGTVAEEHPEQFAEAAVSLHRIGDPARRKAARAYLAAGLASEDSSTRAWCALGLGRIGNLNDYRENNRLREELRRLAAGVDQEALLAGSLLDRFQEKESHQRLQDILEQKLLEGRKDSSGGRKGKAGRRSSGENGEGIDPADADLAVLKETLELIQRYHMEGQHFSRQELIDAAADGMLHRLDPHSTFLASDEFKNFSFEMNPEYGGIGAYVQTRDGVFTITRPIYSGPAYEAGLVSGDQVLTVDGWSTIDQPDEEIIKRLKGVPGTEVQVEIMRRGWTEPRQFQLTRRKIEIPTLHTEILPGGVLYMELISFSTDVARHISQAILEARKDHPIKGVVLDLRNNPGGYLSQAVGICDVFLPPGKTVVTVKSRTQATQAEKTRRPAIVPPDVPLVILVNRFSASASEIVSGALSVHGRAVTVGERTFGKGSVQNLLPLRSESGESFQDSNHNGIHDEWEKYQDRNGNGKYDFGPRIKLTMAYYYLPDGKSIHTLRNHDGKIVEQGGVQPQVEVAFPPFASWKVPLLDPLFKKHLLEDYARKIFAENTDLAIQLAEFDGRDASRYPGWDAFFKSLDTRLSPGDVRRWVRIFLRRVVADARGKTFPFNGAWMGDYVEDPQLQEGVRQVLQRAGEPIAEVREYAELFAKTLQAAEEEGKPPEGDQG
ncbi:MAG: S41 family peptidase [Planctomycetota bacterium]